MCRCKTVYIVVGGLLLAGVAAGQVREATRSMARPVAVSPGRADGFGASPHSCPTFSWGGVESAASYELVVVRAESGSRKALGDTALRVTLPGSAHSYTPDLGSCLEGGRRYAWLTRARVSRGGDGDGIDDPIAGSEGAEGNEWSAWSEPAFFEVVAAPSATEVEAALEVLRRHLESGDSARPAAVSNRIGLVERADELDRPEVPRDRTSSTDRMEQPLTVPSYGLRATTSSADGAAIRAENTAAGADVVLGGSPVAELSEVSFSRSSASPLAFDFANEGGGGMTLRVDGIDVVTTATDQDTLYAAGNQLQLTGGTTFDVLEGPDSGLDADTLDGLSSAAFLGSAVDDWVNEAGDTMTGLLTLDPASGFALQTGDGDAIDFGGDLYQDGALFVHRRGTRNTAVGREALAANTTGADNTAVGNRALTSNDTGASNTAVGSYALRTNTNASRNTAVGFESMRANSTGYYNTALGAGALRNASTAVRNTAVGNRAMQSNTAGSRNTALGHRALYGSSGNNSTAIGAFALETGGIENTAVGAYALRATTTGYSNTAVGQHALYGNTTGKNNTAVGRLALQSSTSAYANTAVGAFAMLWNTTGLRNTAIGDLALVDNVSGHDNIAIGFRAGYGLALDNNIAIGNLGNALDANRIRIGSTQTETFVAGISGNTVAGGIPVIVNASGELGTTTSSRRFKEEIHDLGGASASILALRPVSFRYTREAAGPGDRPLEYGLIAEEVAEVFPELVVLDETGRPFTVKYHLLVPLLLNELQAARRDIRELQAELRDGAEVAPQ